MGGGFRGEEGVGQKTEQRITESTLSSVIGVDLRLLEPLYTNEVSISRWLERGSDVRMTESSTQAQKALNCVRGVVP